MNEAELVGLLVDENTMEIKRRKREKYLVIKRGLDIVISFLALILLAPIFLLISLLIKIDSPGKVFFKHKRIGKDGKYIYLYKFRTMYKNADEMKKRFTKEQIEEYERDFKLKNDPRVTKIGKFLRKTSLDELPQLLNILKGDMALIGPRPVVEKEIEKYGMLKNIFLSVTPGLTGYWACNGRSCTNYDERIKLELFYVYNFCFKLDLKIFFKTIKSVITKEGAI